MSKKYVQLYAGYTLEKFYRAVRNNRLHKIHIPHSDVYYVKAAVDAHYNKSFSLKHVENAMKAEGWKDNG
jgi:hypothetical protein|tara:strand:- start:240 stop:449 length:210 start_codon:yes stop_codon:yes gene_type:complete